MATEYKKFGKTPSEMQQRGTRFAHEAMLRLGRASMAKQYIHTVANELVDEAIKRDCGVIVYKELMDICEQLSYADWHHVWAFRRLVECVGYETLGRAVTVEQGKPNQTVRASGVRIPTVGSLTRTTATASSLGA